MKYISNDSKVPIKSPHNGYWVRNDEIFDMTSMSHVQFLIERPFLFNLTGKQILAVYKKHGELVGTESKAREELVRTVAESGWIRVRHYTNPKDFWSIQSDDCGRRKKDIRGFLTWALEQRIMQPDSEAQIVGFNNVADFQEFRWADGGVGRYLSKEKG